ncbi:MAG: hypothetical protein ABIC91_07420 [Nanoarchaeota archaeon]
MSKKEKLILFLLVIIYSLVLLLMIFTSDKLMSIDECYIGTVAKEIIRGPALSFFDYQQSDYSGESLVAAILLAPIFLIFGISIASLKMVTLFFNIPILIITFVFLKRFFNLKVAILTSVLFIFSPPIYTTISLIAITHIIKSFLFGIIILYLFYNIFYNNKYDMKNFILLGLISGFAVWFSYMSLVFIFICFLFWFVFDKKFLIKKRFIIFLIFFLIGMSPWFYYNFTHEFSGIWKFQSIYGIQDFQTRFEQGFDKLKNLFLVDFLDSFRLRDFNSLKKPHLFAYFYYFIFLTSFFFLSYINRKSILRFIFRLFSSKKTKIHEIRKETFFLIYFMLYCLIFALSNFYLHTFTIDHFRGSPRGYTFFWEGAEGYQYISILYPFIFIIISLFLSRLFNTKSSFFKKTSLVLTVFFVAYGASGMYVLIDLDNFNFQGHADYEPACYLQLIFALYAKIGYTPEIGTKLCERLDEEHYYPNKISCYERIGSGISSGYAYNLSLAMNQCDFLEKKYGTICYKGVGRRTLWWSNYNLNFSLNLCKNLDEFHKPFCEEGVLLEDKKRDYIYIK